MPCETTSSPCNGNGVCTNDDDYQGFTCACNPGYALETCTGINLCLLVPVCQNGGICSMTEAVSYTHLTLPTLYSV